MKNYLLILSNEEKTMQVISSNNSYYKLYDSYLQKYYGETVEDNEDFIPMQLGDKIIIVYAIEDMDEEFAEDIFDVMQDMLYIRA